MTGLVVPATGASILVTLLHRAGQVLEKTSTFAAPCTMKSMKGENQAPRTLPGNRAVRVWAIRRRADPSRNVGHIVDELELRLPRNS